MAQTKAKAPTQVAAAGTPAKTKKAHPRNYELSDGIYRFSRARMFHKKAIYKFLDKKTPKTVSSFYYIFVLVFLCVILVN